MLQRLKRKEFILTEGDVCNFNLFVNKGCLKFYTLNNVGKEMIRYFAFENKFGTALTSFIDQKPSNE